MDYELIQIGINSDTVVDSIFEDIREVLDMAEQDGIEWLSTQDIIQIIDRTNGNHIHGILRIMYKCRWINAAQAKCISTGAIVHLWQSIRLPL